MRKRLLYPDFFQNPDLAELPAATRLLLAGLWCAADREGRLEDDPRRIRAAVFPYETTDVEPMLAQLAAAGFIVRYSVDGRALAWIPDFLDHQHPHKNEVPSRWDPYDAGQTQGRPKADQRQTKGRPRLPVSVSVPVPVPESVSVAVAVFGIGIPDTSTDLEEPLLEPLLEPLPEPVIEPVIEPLQTAHGLPHNAGQTKGTPKADPTPASRFILNRLKGEGPSEQEISARVTAWIQAGLSDDHIIAAARAIRATPAAEFFNRLGAGLLNAQPVQS